jgi:hypothetical protein
VATAIHILTVEPVVAVLVRVGTVVMDRLHLFLHTNSQSAAVGEVLMEEQEGMALG